jgi:hypothetical protein
MDDVTRGLYGFFAAFLLLFAFLGCWIPLSGFIEFFTLNDVVNYSWKSGFMIFVVPFILYFVYLIVCSVVKNEFVKMNTKLGNTLGILPVLGIVFGMLSSTYIDQNLKNNDYKVCPSKSLMLPNKYVKDIKLCGQ